MAELPTFGQERIRIVRCWSIGLNDKAIIWVTMHTMDGDFLNMGTSSTQEIQPSLRGILEAV